MKNRSKFATLLVVVLTMAAILAFSRVETNAQSCELMVGGYFDPDSGQATVTNMPATELLTETSAYAISKKSGQRYSSVLTNRYRNFGDIPSGNYKVYISRPGYKTTIYSIDLDCEDASERGMTESIRMWKGNSRQIVDNSDKPGSVKEMRLERLTRLGVSDSDSGARIASPAESSAAAPRSSGNPKTVSGGVLNGKAISLPTPSYPPAALAVRAAGSVSVQVLVGEDGNVISAHAVSGHPLLRSASEAAAREARFAPTLLDGTPVKVSGVITYNFVP